jgi:AmmeMemoRadiSam system radical SAM enzyme/AmmeMemoRadiSam system protein B/AmmeMemoRadiSam system protein A
MGRRIDLPPEDRASADGTRAGGWWHDSPDGARAVCDLCPRSCSLGVDARGFCAVRQNRGGRIVSTTYGRSTGFCIDPIEKKPLNHFFPGTSVLSFGTAGCNLGCKFCQNWTMSKSREVQSASAMALPDDIARTAREHGCRSVAFTYNDPIVWAEYAIDTARACRLLGVKTVAVTNGYISSAARAPFFSAMDAANVDLKGFTEDFYWKLTGGHLAAVLDTFRWLIHESDVWVEITNLVIPQGNDAPDDLKRMCDWIAAELRPDVPIHFTAFHPDFRLVDRGSTPASTLRAAHQIARLAGLKYVYTGNLSDPEHQSTYCPQCGRAVIGRNGYEIGVFNLHAGRCKGCGEKIAGHFDAAPGDWGGRRQPVRIAAPRNESKGGTLMENSEIPRPQTAPQRPQLSKEQEDAVFRAAAEQVAAAVKCLSVASAGVIPVEMRNLPVFGVFVSLKRAGQLRSCCGYLGQSIGLGEALEHAAVRAAKDDPRFPPISPGELPHLDMEVWVLWGMEPVAECGEDRVDAVEIGRHGLQISRGSQRGLLLPGVAVEHRLDARAFLRQVCLKAGLPPEAWKDGDTQLARFEGYAIRGRLDASSVPRFETVPGGPTPKEAAALASFCRENVLAMLYGATPSYYLPGGFDGGVSGVVLSLRLPGRAETIDCSKVSLRPEMPLQASLLDLARAAADALRSMPASQEALARMSCGITVLWDTAMHGTLDRPDLSGVDPTRRALLVVDASKWWVFYNPSRSAAEVLIEAVARVQPGRNGRATVYSFAAVSTEARLITCNAPQPKEGPALRPAVVADRFYPGTAAEIDRTLEGMLPKSPPRRSWTGAMVPHAGWVYSGRLAAETLARIVFPSRVIVVCPKHHANGAQWAVAPHRAWEIPGGEVPSDPDLAHQLADCVAGLELDSEAHRAEHAIEVQLPILARLAPHARVVGIAIHGGDFEHLERFAEQMAGVLLGQAERPLLLVSSDMSHYGADAPTRQIDRLALDAIESLDPRRVYDTVRGHRISMCGVLPAVLVMQTLRRMGALHRCEPVGYATSADASGDTSRVVGYAAMLFE